MSDKNIKIFISSTYGDLKNIRKKIIDEIKQYSPFLEPIYMESFLPDNKRSQKTSIEYLEKSDVYLLIMGKNYGSTIKNCEVDNCLAKEKCERKGISYTHCEFRYATMGKNTPGIYIKLKFKDEDIDEKQKKFIEEVENSVTINPPIEVKSEWNEEKIAEKIIEELRRSLPKKIVEWYDDGKLHIPEFYGRQKELKEVWKKFDKGKTICITGVGGIGKTTLAEVLLILKAFEGYKIKAIYRETSYSSGTGYKPFRRIIENVGIEKYTFTEKLDYSLLCEAIAGIKGTIEPESLVDILNREKILLLIDDAQLADDKVIAFLSEYSDMLTNATVITTSRKYLGITEIVEISGIERDYEGFVKYLTEGYGIEVDENSIKEIKEISRGHPLLTKIIVRNLRRYPLEKLKEKIVKNIKDLKGDEYVEEFLKRFIKENIKGDKLRALKFLSVFRTGIDNEVVKVLNLKENVLPELADWLMLKSTKSGYVFYDDTVKECTYSFLSEKEKREAHKKAVEYYKRFYDDYLEKRKIDNIRYVLEYIYHLVMSNKFKEAWNVVADKKTLVDIRLNINLEELVKVLEVLHKNLEGYEKAKILLQLGITYDEIGNFNRSIDCLKRSVDNLEEYEKAESYRHLSYAYIRIGNIIGGLKSSLNVLNFVKDKKEIIKTKIFYGIVCWYLSNFEVSLISFEKAFGIYREVYTNIGEAQIKLGSVSEAYNSFKKGLEVSDDELVKGYNLYGIGYTLMLLGEDSLKELKKANEIFLKMKHFRIPHSFMSIGIYYHLKDRLEKAEKYYNEALNRATYDYIKAVALYNLGILYEDLKKFDKAEDYFKRVNEIFEKYWFTYGKAKVLHHLGLIEELKSNYKRAEKLYEESLKLKENLTAENKNKIEKMIKEDEEFRQLVENAKRYGIDVVNDFSTKNVDRLGRAITLGQLGILKIKEGNVKKSKRIP